MLTNGYQHEEKVSKESDDRPLLQKDEVEIVFLYIQSWSQRQCMCCFRDPKNYERFNLITQSIICLAVCQLKELRDDLAKAKAKAEKKNVDSNREDSEKRSYNDSSVIETSSVRGAIGGKSANGAKEYRGSGEKRDKVSEERSRGGTKEKGDPMKEDVDEDDDDGEEEEDEEEWSIQEKEKLLHFLSKVFLLNFPLYVAYKHTVQAKLEEISQQEASSLNVFCDLHDPEIPVYLLRNVCLFCKSGGVHAMTFCFERQNPDTLPVSLAHAMIAIVCNLKLWLNFRSIMQLFVPLRAKVLRYMCSLADKDLRLPGIKTMADFMWSAVKDPLDSPLTFDRDGLDLAFKYFTSSTLTMRLAGIAQINSHINMFNELCNSESIVEVESVGYQTKPYHLKFFGNGMQNH
ncbi:Ubiquitin carboxyl-terminal hydrolase puf [Gryllus bimaculatus]|nr:Ubiquitin carboxyl-terminal hydrolase puf [Gryllus bimaculatus]